MKKFSYVAKDTSGKTIKGIYEAEDAQEVLDKIHEQGLFCISYTEALGGAGKQSVHKFNTKELAFCCRQLAAGAGINNTSVAGVRCFGGVQLAAAAKAGIDKPLLL